MKQKEMDELRSAIYKGLSDSYRPPDTEIPEHVATLREAVLEAYPDIRLDEHPERQETSEPSAASDQESTFSDLEGPDRLEELKIDHARLFVGPFSLLAPPYGSMYLDQKEQLMTDSSMHALQWYESEGMDVAIKEVPDHIRIELEFMFFLIMNEYQSENGSEYDWQRKQRQFLEQHLGRWVAGFEKKTCSQAQTRLYSVLGHLTGRFVLRDLDQLRKK